VLHVEIGLVNDLLSALYEWVDKRVEPISTEEQSLRNAMILALLQYQNSRRIFETFKLEEQIQCTEWKLERATYRKQITALNRKRQLSTEEESKKDELETIIEAIDKDIEVIETREDTLKKEVQMKRESYHRCKKETETYRNKINKVEHSLYSRLEGSFSKYEVDPAAYHRVKLNGVACQKLTDNCVDIFAEVEECCIDFIRTVDGEGLPMNTADEAEVHKHITSYRLTLALLGKAFHYCEQDGDWQPMTQ